MTVTKNTEIPIYRFTDLLIYRFTETFLFKKGNALIIGLVVVFLIFGALGVYYFINLNSSTGSGQATSVVSEQIKTTSAPSPTQSIEEDLNSIQISTDEMDLQELQKEAGSL